MKIGQISAGDEVSKLAVEGLVKSAPILQDVEFYSKAGAADSVKVARQGSTTSIFRAINTDNTPTPPTNTYNPVAKKIVSFDACADVILEDRNEDPETELAYQTLLEAIEAGYVLQEKIFEGDVDTTNEFDGMRNLVDADQILTVATNGLVVPLGNSDAKVYSQQQAIEELLKLFASIRGGATHAYMNELLKIRFLTVAKNLGYYRQSKDEVGSEIDMIGDVIVRGAGRKSDGTLLLPFDETVGSATTCSSIFACRWGERIDLTALTSAGVKGRYAGQIGNQLINNINLDMALTLQNKYALTQSIGWKIE